MVDDHEQPTSAVLMLPDGTMYGLLTVIASLAGIDVLWMANAEKNTAVSVPA